MSTEPADCSATPNSPSPARRPGARVLRLWALSLCVALTGNAAPAENAALFAPPAPAKPKVVRLLAYSEYFDPATLDAFERANGYEVAYDTYDSQDAIAEKWREGPYDLVVLPGPALKRRIAQGGLARIDKSKLKNAKAIQPAVTGRLAAYDPTGAYSVAFGWSATGLLYDADKATPKLGGAPASWANVFLPREAGKMADCGIVLPDSRDALFIAAWRLMNVDPARATPLDAKTASALIARARPTIRAFALRDVVGALAGRTACLSLGVPSAAAAATARAVAGGETAPIRFAYAREGGALSIDAFALPVDAPHPDQAYALLDFLMQPENAGRSAKTAGVTSAEAAGQDDVLKHSWPEGAYDDRMSAAIEAAWTSLRAAK